MNSICITGYLPIDLGLVEDILSQAGMEAALASQRDTSLSISVWHQQVAALLAKENHSDKDELGSTANLGRLWEQLASDIFISNLHTPTWGWADTRSAPLLAFWKNFDPQLRFVLVVCSPERLLAHAIESSTDTPNVEQILDQWRSYTEALLAFHQANPKRSIIVNVQDCIDQPAVFLQTLNKKWGLQLNKVHFPNIAAVGFSDLTKYLAAGLVSASPAHKELGTKLQKTSSLSSAGLRDEVIPSHTELIQWFRKMRVDVLQRGQDQLAFQAKHTKLLERFEQERAINTEQSAQNFALERKQKELSTALADAKHQLGNQTTIAEDLNVKLRAANSKLEASASAEKDLKEESELLSLQLHQVQKELETHFLKYQELTKEVESTQFQLAETRAQLAADQSAREESNAALVAARNEQDRQSEIAIDLTAKLSAANAQREASASIEKDLKEESELLLLQLHQVQEELEVYFLKYQETTKEVETAQARWRRMLVRNPDYCDVESIAIEPVPKDKTHRSIWTIKGLDAGGRHIPEISFATFIEKGIAGLEFSRADSGSGAFLRWPSTLAEDKTLTVAMSGDVKASEKRALAVIGLATSDWSLLSVLINLLRKALSSASLLKAPQDFDAAVLIKALDKLDINLKALPEVLRYDKVKLKREQVNPDYEHLWFSFENMKASGQLIGDFEYRISCASVRPKKFGDHPKLEFPETCKTAIQSWFEESYDDYGAKLELRFALPESMDMEVWGKLTPHDQLFIRDLVGQLPFVIADLRINDKTPRRGWEDWKVMIHQTQQVLTMRAEPSKSLPTTRKTNPRKSVASK